MNKSKETPQPKADRLAQGPELEHFRSTLDTWTAFMDETPRAVTKLRNDYRNSGTVVITGGTTEVLPLFSQPEEGEEVGDAMWVVRTGEHVAVEVDAPDYKGGVYEYTMGDDTVKKFWRSDAAITGVEPMSVNEGLATQGELDEISEKLGSASPTVL